MHKFFIDKSSFKGNSAVIQGEDVKHIYKVLRLQAGDEILINDCEGKEYISRIESIDKKNVKLILVEEFRSQSESPIEIYLYQGLPKSSKMDLIVQKSAELGVKAITPILTERVVVKSEIGEFTKVDRWTRIALEACKQCKRRLIPKVNLPIEFNDLVKELRMMDLIVVPYENENNYGIKKMMKEINLERIKSIAVIIGPEGGFEAEEIDKFKELGAFIVTLGPRILRTETAGFVCTSLLQYELGDMGGIF